jgi:glycosyltransferase involved in cell wall biosynthesis
MSESDQQPANLKGIRVLAAINGMELFGHERGNIEVFKALRDQGAEVKVGVNAREDGGSVGRHLRSIAFETFMVPFGPQWSLKWLKLEGPVFAWNQCKNVLGSSRVFSQQIRSFKPTHFALGSELAYSFLALALLRCRQPLIWRMGDAPPTESLFNFPIWKMGMRRAARVVANSRYVAGTAVSAGLLEDKISVINNLAPDFGSDKEADPVPTLQYGQKALIYVGSVSEHKGVALLVDAFAKVAEHEPMLQLWILGGSIYDSEFRQRLVARVHQLRIHKRVTLVGHVKEPGPWFAAASVHIAPSIWEEPFANVVLEAKRSGTPSIVFPSGGLPEMVRHEVDGYICHTKTVQSLAEGIRWMLANSTTLTAMAKAAAEDSELRFGRPRFLRQWAEVYQNSHHPL